MIETIPNQPVAFNFPEDACRCGAIQQDNFFKRDDWIPFQWKFEPCDDEQEIISEPIFLNADPWVFGTGWTYFTNIIGGTPQARHSGPQGDLTEASILDTGQYYCVTVKVVSITGSLLVILGDNTIGTITRAGEYTFAGFCTTTTDFILRATSNTEVWVDEVSCKAFKLNQLIGIKNNVTGAFVVFLRLEDYATTASAVNPPFSLVDKWVTGFLKFDEDWLNLPVGCYSICLFDPCVNTCGQNGLENYSFEKLDYAWTLNATTISSGSLFFTSLLVGQTGQATQEADLCAGMDYKVTITVAANLYSEIDIKLGTNVIGSVSTNSPGVHVFTGQASGGTDFEIEFRRTLNNLVGSDAEVTEVFIELSDAREYVPDYCSQEFSIGNDFPCSIYVNACPEAEYAFGMRFGVTGFSPAIRLISQLRNAQYEIDRKMELSSLGKNSVRYYERRKNKEFAVDHVEEYTHDFLSILPGMNNIWIDDKSYVAPEDEYQLEYAEDAPDVAPVTILLEETVQNVSNILCEITNFSCNIIGAQYLDVVETDDSPNESDTLEVTDGVFLQL